MGGKSKAVESVFDKIAAKIAETKATRNPQLDTPQFKKAFSDTKVVDANGEPRLMYHGSPVRGFSEFDKSTINPNDPDALYNGFWFTSKKDSADGAGSFPWGRPNTPGGGETRAFYLSIKNPATHRDAYQALRAIEARGDVPTREAVRLELTERGFDGAVFEPGFEPTLTQRADFDRTGRLQIDKNQWIEKNAQDGSVDLFDRRVGGQVTGFSDLDDLMTSFETQYVAFEPTQIKSATGNSGAFDMTNPDITKALIGAVSGGALSQAPELLTRPEEVQAEGYADGGWTGDDSDRLDALVAQQANPAPVGATHWTGGSGVPGDRPTIQGVAGGIWDDAAARNMAQYKNVAPKSNDLTPYVGPHLAQGVKNVYDILNPIMPAVDDDGTEHGLGERLAWDTFGLSTLGVPIAKYAAQTATPYLQAAAPELQRLMTKYGPAATAGVSLMPDDAEASIPEQLAKLAARLGDGELAKPFHSRMHLASMDAKPGEYSLDQWKKIFLGKAVKPQEIDWNLRNHPFGDRPVSQQEMRDFLDQGALKPTETRMSESAPSSDVDSSHGSWEVDEPDDDYLMDDISNRLDELKERWADRRGIPLEEVDEEDVIRQALDDEHRYYYQDSDSPQSNRVDVTLPDGSQRTFYLTSGYGEANMWSPGFNGGDEMWYARPRDIFDEDKVNEVIRDHLEKQGLLDQAPGAERRVQYGPEDYSQYLTPGGSDYREMTLHLPQEHVRGEEFTGAHHEGLPEDNILAHIRYQTFLDQDGKKVLHIDEAQSDWHQKAHTTRMGKIRRLANDAGITDDREALAKFGKDVGPDWGYQTPEAATAMEEATARYDDARRALQTFDNTLTRNSLTVEAAPQYAKEREALEAEVNAAADATRATSERLLGTYPDAPYKTDWSKLVAKRMTKWAADNDIDRITWTTGQQQSERYNLSSRVQNIRYEGGRLYAKDSEGREVAGQAVEPTVEALSRYVGDELARRLVGSISPAGYGELTGDGLKITKSGKNAVYDNDLHQAFNEIGKQYGAKARSAFDTNPVRIGADQHAPDAALPPDFDHDFVNRNGWHSVAELQRSGTQEEKDRLSAEYRTLVNDIRKKHREEWLRDNLSGTPSHSFDIPNDLKNFARRNGFEAFAGGGRVQVRDRLDQLKADVGRRKAGALQ